MEQPGIWQGYQYNVPFVPIPQNRFVYVKQNFVPQPPQPVNKTVHVNPNFSKKVFVNPNFQGKIPQQPITPSTIHVNPNSQKIKLTLNKKLNSESLAMMNAKPISSIVETKSITTKIHVNPNVLRTIPNPAQNKKELDTNVNKMVYSSRTKIIRKPVGTQNVSKGKLQRISISTKYKMVKSPLLLKQRLSIDIKNKAKVISPCIKNKSVIVKLSPLMKKKNKYKLDNRKTVAESNGRHSLKFSKLRFVKKQNLLKIGDVLYKKSPNSLRRTSDVKKMRKSSVTLKPIKKTKYKIVRKSAIKNVPVDNLPSKKSLSISKSMIVKVRKVTVSPGKLRKCNIPCPFYRKYGRCRAYEQGKCYRKHDPGQIALCTRFLQGACINEKCLLSHNVSPEKMPTCKYYLEGSCSKDECPYLHVKISPKADICKDFIEGFCKKATECDKRHQFLCPDYEKHGKCLKQRCPYPHGRMVRKYSVFDRDRFAKKSSENDKKSSDDVEVKKRTLIDCKETAKSEGDVCKNVVKTRYYDEQTSAQVDLAPSTGENKIENRGDCEFDLTSRPKLGELPSFIAFQDS